MNPERSRIAIDTKCHHSTSEITQTKVDGRPIGLAGGVHNLYGGRLPIPGVLDPAPLRCGAWSSAQCASPAAGHAAFESVFEVGNGRWPRRSFRGLVGDDDGVAERGHDNHVEVTGRA